MSKYSEIRDKFDIKMKEIEKFMSKYDKTDMQENLFGYYNENKFDSFSAQVNMHRVIMEDHNNQIKIKIEDAIELKDFLKDVFE